MNLAVQLVPSRVPISVDVWLGLTDSRSEIVGPRCVAFDVAPNRMSAIAIAGRRNDGLIHVEITDSNLLVYLVADKVEKVADDSGASLIVVDAFAEAGAVVEELAKRGASLHRIKHAEHAAAVELMINEVAHRTLRHTGSLSLVNAILGANLRLVSGSYLWGRADESVDLSPLVAASLAVWAARQ